MKPNSATVAVASALLSAALSGCVVAPAPGYYADVAVTEVAPPPVQYEVVGVAPTPGYIWIGGAWFWEGGRYAWHPGHWEAPRPGYRMQGGGWEREGREEHREEHEHR